LLRQVVGVEETVVEGIGNVTDDRVVVAVLPRFLQRNNAGSAGGEGGHTIGEVNVDSSAT